MNLNNKKILIIGASGGIGNAILENLLQKAENCTFYALFHSNSVEKANLGNGNEVIGIKADLSQDNAVVKIFAGIEDIDVLINAHGVELEIKDPLDSEEWLKSWKINFFSIVDICNKAIKILNKNGVIINISSIMGKHDIAVPIELSSYAVGKTALTKFTNILAYNLAPNFRAVTVSPGYTMTKLWDVFDEQMKNECIEDTPIKRFIKPEEIAKAVYSVIENDAITGQDIVVDGGLGMRLIS